MSTGIEPEDDAVGERWRRSPREVGRAALESLVNEPDRSVAWTFAAVAYLGLFVYMVGTALGALEDPIPADDWLTLVFTTYALLSSLGLAHRLYRAGVEELTREYFADVVALTWLTAFYFVWTVARSPPAETTTVVERYAPLLAGDPGAVLWGLTMFATAVLAAGAVGRPAEGTTLFETPLRTALVTLPCLVTATVLVVRPGPGSFVWAAVSGAFVGTLLGGVTYGRTIVELSAKSTFACFSLAFWAIGAGLWWLGYRRGPPNGHPLLERVEVGVAAAEEEPERTRSDGVSSVQDDG